MKPIHEVIKCNPTREVVAAEWTGKPVAQEPVKVATKRPTFGKKVSR